MSSTAKQSFDDNINDVTRLLQLHSKEGGKGTGRRHGLEVLNKSAIVLITAYWEAYCEDVAAEALKHIVRHAKSPDRLSEELKKRIAKQVKGSLHDFEVWKLAGSGWKSYLTNRLATLQEERNRKLNTPKADNINELFVEALGISKISSSWRWQGMSPDQAVQKLDEYVTLRGDIAHRGKHSKSIRRSKVEDFLNFAKLLAEKTDGNVNTNVKQVTKGKALW